MEVATRNFGMETGLQKKTGLAQEYFLYKNRDLYDIYERMNTFGRYFRVTTFGESHGGGLGAVIDGCAPGLELSAKDIQTELDRRRPGQSDLTTPRKESDTVEIISGVFEGKTTGTPIMVLVRNADQRSQDYGDIAQIYRPSHADMTYDAKYGIRDYRGGGRSSGRETIGRVIGGAVARKILSRVGIDMYGFARAIGGQSFPVVDRDFIEQNPLRMADESAFSAAEKMVTEARNAGDSLGGIVEVRVTGMKAGLGSPVFGKLEAELARACMSVGAVKGFEIGEGFALAAMKGSEANDPFVTPDKTERNGNGGILGGISTGEDIWFRVAVKPTPSIGAVQHTVRKDGTPTDLQIKGRHDPIIVPRVIPVLEAMTAMVLVDALMADKAQCELF